MTYPRSNREPYRLFRWAEAGMLRIGRLVCLGLTSIRARLDMHASFMPLGFAFPGLVELVILVIVSCFLLGTWRPVEKGRTAGVHFSGCPIEASQCVCASRGIHLRH